MFSLPARLSIKNTEYREAPLCCGPTLIGNAIILRIYRTFCSVTTLYGTDDRSTSCATVHDKIKISPST